MTEDSTSDLSLNRRIQNWKASLKAAAVRAEIAELGLAKAEAALRNMTLAHAREKARAERAETLLASLGGPMRRTA